MVECLTLKPVQVSSRDHRWDSSSWCWSQYRCHHVLTGETQVLDVEASTGGITHTAERTLFQWRRWDRLVCRVQRTLYWTILYISQPLVWHHLYWQKRWRHRNNRLHHQQQQKHRNYHHLHLCVLCLFFDKTHSITRNHGSCECTATRGRRPSHASLFIFRFNYDVMPSLKLLILSWDPRPIQLKT